MCVCGKFKKKLLEPVCPLIMERHNDRIISAGGKNYFRFMCNENEFI